MRWLPLATLALATIAVPAQAYEVVDKPLKKGFARLKVNVGGFVQPRFRFTPDDPDAGVNGEVGFSLQRARLEISGDLLAPDHRPFGFSIRQKYSVELMPEPRLQDAYVDFAFGTFFQLRVGQFKAPVHRAILVSDAFNLFPDRNRITTFVPEREIGLMLHGYWGERYIEWQGAIFNGEGKNRIGNVNRKFLYVGRLVFSPLGSPGARREILRDWKPKGDERNVPYFSVGGSFFYNVDGPPGQEEAYVGANVEGFLHYRFLTVMSEFFWRQSDWEVVSLADYTQIGWYVQFGAFWEGVPWAEKHLALMGRVEQGDSFKPLRGEEVPPSGPLDPTQASRRYSVGLGLYAGEPLFRFLQDLRFVVSYTVREELEGFPFDNNELNLSANLTF